MSDLRVPFLEALAKEYRNREERDPCFLVLGQAQVGKSLLIKKIIPETYFIVMTEPLTRSKRYDACVNGQVVTFVDTPSLLQGGGNTTIKVLQDIHSYLLDENLVPSCIVYVTKFYDNVTQSSHLECQLMVKDFFGKIWPSLNEKIVAVLTFSSSDVTSLAGASLLPRNATPDQHRLVWLEHLEARKQHMRTAFGQGCQIVAVDNRESHPDLLDGSLWFPSLLVTLSELLSNKDVYILDIIENVRRREEQWLTEVQHVEEKCQNEVSRQPLFLYGVGVAVISICGLIWYIKKK
eukprot:TRINITY_DN92_c0_g1_i1.p1 TRINITY_DN92_c0_g1~~TRINITY_DN92_c0_g1_i1.p1  ORF type:complete len:293 (-),score=51.84 TRINITY_DN92_c0_g1_i1:94-972(-)